jgi:DNA-binding CsgD family transcriptional regulator/tetratricopeptide (TPR) repeat protein
VPGHQGNPHTMPMVGRHQELAAVACALAASGPRVVVIEGPSGIGKSTVWRAAVDAAVGSGWRLVAVRPREVEASMSFAALQGLLGESLDAAAEALPPPQRLGLDVALLRTAPGEVPVDARVVGAGTLGVLRALASRDRLLVAIDDAQWLDPASADALAFSARRLSGDRVRLLVTWRTEAGPVDLGLDSADLFRLPIPALPPPALREIVRAQLGHSLGTAAARALHQVSGGNPFYALELSRSRPDGDFGFDRPLNTGDVQTLVGRRLVELPSATLHALATVAAMTDADVARVGELIPDGVILDPAFTLGILIEREPGRIEFTHPLLAAATYAAMVPRQRRAIHLRLAQHATSVEDKARHLALSVTAADAGVAAAVDAGAAAASARGACADAARLAETAARLTPPGDRNEWGARRLAAARWHLAAGETKSAVEIWTQLAADCAAGEVRAEALSQLALSGGVDYDQALAMCEQAVAESVTVHSRLRRTAVHAFVVANSDNQRALTMQRAAVAEARAAQDEVALRAVLPDLGFHTALSTPELDGVPLLREAVELERRVPGAVDAYLSPENRLGIVLVQRNELTEARALLRQHLDACLDRGDEGGGCGVAVHLCEAELRGGNLSQAQTDISWALTVADDGRPSQNLCMMLAYAALIAAHRGEVDRARTMLKRIEEMIEHVGEPHSICAHRVTAGFLELSLANYPAALAWLEPTVTMLRAVGYVEPGTYFFLPDRLEALIATGRHEEAERDIAEWEAIGHRYDRPFPLASGARARGMLLAGRGRLAEADDAFAEALREHKRLDWPHQHARTLLAYGRVLRRCGRRRDARSNLDGALRIFDCVGEPLWARQARDEISRLGGRTPSRHTLTDGERRVVELVASGRSNREAAAELTISTKTVEAALTRAYVKLDVRSRAQLAATWSATDQPIHQHEPVRSASAEVQLPHTRPLK